MLGEFAVELGLLRSTAGRCDAGGLKRSDIIKSSAAML